jgi:hypothetical protein
VTIDGWPRKAPHGVRRADGIGSPEWASTSHARPHARGTPGTRFGTCRRLLAAALLCLPACGEAERGAELAWRAHDLARAKVRTFGTTTDLNELFVVGQARMGTPVVDLSTSAGLSALVSGWHVESAHTWGLGERSVIGLDIRGKPNLSLRLSCWPLSYAGAPGQTLVVVLNGRPIDARELAAGRQEVCIDLPSALLVDGDNAVEFIYGWCRRPVDVLPGSEDSRELAVAFQSIEVEGARQDGPRPSIEGEDDSVLVLPSGSSSSSMQAAAISFRLWGGMSVAMPTAMPCVPFSSTFGRRAGRSCGSSSVPSKFGVHSTVPWPSSDSSVCAYGRKRDSV